jgi:hypothetical protein
MTPSSVLRSWQARALGCALAALAAATHASAQTAERTLYVTALDAKGAVVTALAPADVTVREDGVAREVLRVEPATEPLQVTVLIDTSAALSPDEAETRRALEAFFQRLLTGTHEAALVEFGDRPSVLVEPTSSLPALLRGVGRVFPRPSSGAYLLDAIVETTRRIQKGDAPRPVIVAIATEGVEFSVPDHQRVLDPLKASGAALHVLTLTRRQATGMITDEERARNVVVDRGTVETGGQRDIILSAMGLDDALLKVADQLMNQVKVVYGRPQTLIPPEKIVVSAARDGLTVRGTPARPVRPGGADRK